jgi:hypothetical protein
MSHLDDAANTPEVEALKKQLAAAKAELDGVRLQLKNVMVLLKKEMTASGRLPHVANSQAADQISN